MGLISKLFGNRKTEDQPARPPEHCLIVEFQFHGGDPRPVFQVGDELSAALSRDRAGEFDGNELAADCSSGSLYLYGPDADRLLAVARPVLLAHAFLHGAKLLLRYGPPAPGVARRELTLAP